MSLEKLCIQLRVLADPESFSASLCTLDYSKSITEDAGPWTQKRGLGNVPCTASGPPEPHKVTVYGDRDFKEVINVK